MGESAGVVVGGPSLVVMFSAMSLLFLAGPILGIVTAISASSLPEWAFERAGTSKTLWIVLPLIGIVACGVVSLVAAIMWFASYKPRVVAASRATG